MDFGESGLRWLRDFELCEARVTLTTTAKRGGRCGAGPHALQRSDQLVTDVFAGSCSPTCRAGVDSTWLRVERLGARILIVTRSPTVS